MQLRDEIELWGTGPDEEDEYGDPIPGTPGKLATCPAQVYAASATIIMPDGGGNRILASEKLRALIREPGFELKAVKNWVVWKGDKYNIDGVLDRSARGKTHHLTLELSSLS